MSPKYADRFRPSASPADAEPVASEPSTEGPASAEPLAPTTADLGARSAGPPWHRVRMAWLALVLALVAGAVAGAYGWGRWRVYEAGLAAGQMVDLAASAVTMDYPSARQITMGVRYQNQGDEDVTLVGARIEGAPVHLSGVVPELTIPPGETASQMLALELDCPDGALPLDLPRLVVTTQTADGTATEHELTSGVSAEVVDWTTYGCDAPVDVSMRDLYIAVGQVPRNQVGPVVRAPVEVGAGGDTEVRIDDVASSSDGVSATYEVTTSVDGFVQVDVTFAVADCTAARVLDAGDLTLEVSGSVGNDEISTVSVPPSATLAIELVRLVERTCAAS